eukprot:jgi/Chlat1/1547/Chrsp122S01821
MNAKRWRWQWRRRSGQARLWGTDNGAFDNMSRVVLRFSWGACTASGWSSSSARGFHLTAASCEAVKSNKLPKKSPLPVPAVSFSLSSCKWPGLPSAKVDALRACKNRPTPECATRTTCTTHIPGRSESHITPTVRTYYASYGCKAVKGVRVSLIVRPKQVVQLPRTRGFLKQEARGLRAFAHRLRVPRLAVSKAECFITDVRKNSFVNIADSARARLQLLAARGRFSPLTRFRNNEVATPRDKLVLVQAGELARKRLARGIRLNHPEAIALIASQVLEFIREGKSVAELMDMGKRFLGRRQVLPGVADMIHEVQVEGTFPDGSKLVTVHMPVCAEHGDLELAFYGSFIPAPPLTAFPEDPSDDIDDTPGKLVPAAGSIAINVGRKVVQVSVENTCDRPIQVGSHYQFTETNPFLVFDRALAYGMRLHVPAGTAVRFEPGETKTVVLVGIGGERVVRGGNNLGDGKVNPQGLATAVASGAQGNGQGDNGWASVMLTHEHYAALYGPTTGDKLRLGDTSLYLEVEKDFTTYGDECVFGGGKVLREGMGQAAGAGPSVALDLVITNAVIVDYTGCYKADIGISGMCCGNIHAIGKAGNPDVMDGVTPGMIVGPTTEVVAAEGKIVTYGAFDAHVHYICPEIINEALASGTTTLLGGGTGPATGTCATTCTPAPEYLRLMLQATDVLPVNIALTGKGNTAKPEGLPDIIRAGAAGLKLHEDWGSTPAAIDCCLTVADAYDVQVTIHTDTLNESSCVEHTIAAEGAGGGHAPDILTVCGEMNVLPSSTNPTRPFTKNTLDEHLDMLMVCHHLDKNIREDVAFAESRIRGETIAAEDILHDMGAISIISSDSQAMGRVGEVITRTWQTADKMKLQRGPLAQDKAADNDNHRIKRYIAKYTINPAIAHGMSHVIGSVEVNKLADLVVWDPAFFGAKPEIVIKGGMIAWAQMGDANASVPTPEPVIMRPMFGALGKAAGACAVAFVSKESIDTGTVVTYGLNKRLEAVKGCRSVTKKDMKLNSALPKIVVDPETYQVTADGVPLICAPADVLPLAQKYFLF